MKSLLLLALLLAFGLGSATSQTIPHVDPHLPSRLRDADVAGYYRMPAAVDDDYFDGTSSRERVQRHMQVARAAGAKYLRCAFTWNAIEHEEGKYNWTFWDMLVDEAEKNGIQLIPYVAYTPEWAAESSDQFWKRPPRDPKLYADFMYQIASRYRGRIHSWEIWNEPDITEYWMGSLDGFAKLVRQAAAAIRKADPNATLILAGMSKGPSPFFTELVEKYHIERLVDVVAMHGYPESWLEEREETVFQGWTERMAETVDDDRVARDLWLNELGYADYRFSPTKANKYGVSAPFPHEHTSDYAAAALFKAQVMALASQKVSLTGWYRIDDFDPETTTFSDDAVNFHLGLINAQHQKKPTFRALAFFNHLFGRPTRTVLAPVVTSEFPDHDSILYVIQRNDGNMVVIGWLRSLNADEAGNADGQTPDERRTSAAVKLPCESIGSVQQFDAQGKPQATTAAFANGWLSGIDLRPDQVFTAEFSCHAAIRVPELPSL